MFNVGNINFDRTVQKMYHETVEYDLGYDQRRREALSKFNQYVGELEREYDQRRREALSKFNQYVGELEREYDQRHREAFPKFNQYVEELEREYAIEDEAERYEDEWFRFNGKSKGSGKQRGTKRHVKKSRGDPQSFKKSQVLKKEEKLQKQAINKERVANSQEKKPMEVRNFYKGQEINLCPLEINRFRQNAQFSTEREIIQDKQYHDVFINILDNLILEKAEQSLDNYQVAANESKRWKEIDNFVLKNPYINYEDIYQESLDDWDKYAALINTRIGTFTNFLHEPIPNDGANVSSWYNGF